MKIINRFVHTSFDTVAAELKGVIDEAAATMPRQTYGILVQVDETVFRDGSGGYELSGVILNAKERDRFIEFLQTLDLEGEV